MPEAWEQALLKQWRDAPKTYERHLKRCAPCRTRRPHEQAPVFNCIEAPPKPPPPLSHVFNDDAIIAAHKALSAHRWPKTKDAQLRRVAKALEVARDKMPDPCEEMITMDRARKLAETFPGGDSTHPLSRHRDSMG